MKQGLSITDMAGEIERQASAKVDFIAHTENLRMRPHIANIEEPIDCDEPIVWSAPTLDGERARCGR